MSADTPAPPTTDPATPDDGVSPSPHEEAETPRLRAALSSAGGDALRYVPARFVPALATLLTVPVFTALISPQDYGAFFLVSSVLLLVSNIAVGWIGSAAVRYYWPLDREGRSDAFVATVVWSAIGALLSTAIVGGAVVWFAHGSLPLEIARLVPAALVFYVLNYLTDLLSGVLRAAKQATTFAKLQTAGALLSTALSIGCVWLGKLGAAGIFAGAALAWLILLFPLLRAVGRLGSTVPSSFDRKLLGEFWHYGMPLVPMYVSSWALILIDRFVIQAFDGSAAVGLYSVAYNLGDKLMQLATVPLLLTMVPSLMEAFERHGQHLAEKVQTQFVRYFALVTFPLVAGLLVTAQTFMHVFTAPAYVSAWPVLAVVAGGSMCASFAQIATTGLSIHHRTKVVMLNALLAAGFNLIANIVLVPRFGYMAAAYDTLLAYLLMMVLAWARTRDIMPLQIPWSDLARITAAATGMGLGVWLAFSHVQVLSRAGAVGVLLAQALAGVALYVILVYALGAIRRDESDAALTTVRKFLGRG